MATHKCFTEGCTTQIADEPGNYYCDECVTEQQREQGDELAAFDAYHRFADACARRENDR